MALPVDKQFIKLDSIKEQNRLGMEMEALFQSFMLGSRYRV